MFENTSKHLKGLNVIIDRDGTIIVDKHYLSNPNEIEMLPGAVDALRQLTKLGAQLFIITNQSGIGRGYFSLEDYNACEARLTNMLKDEGVDIVQTFFCPHAPETACECRKPATGMWADLTAKYNISPDSAVMVGDKMDDVKFGQNCHFAASILVLTGKGEKEVAKYNLPILSGFTKNPHTDSSGTDQQTLTLPKNNPSYPSIVATNLSTAADWIIKNFGQDY